MTLQGCGVQPANLHRTGMNRRIRNVVAVAIVAMALPAHASGQVARVVDKPGTHMSRAQLEQVLAELEQQVRGDATGTNAEAAGTTASLIRQRLRDGDLQVGDRVILHVEAQPQLTDTFTVSMGRVLLLPEIGEVPLQGILRAELQDHLAEHVGRLFRNVSVRAHPLIRVEVMGAIGRPGFYMLSSDMLLSDVLMVAGGPTDRANLQRMTMQRADRVILSGPELRRAMVEGRTLDQLSLSAGDRIEVPEKRNSWDLVQRSLWVVSGIASLFYLAHRVGSSL
jgi:protein involved in polysaccharide export with SLBB domain